MKNIFKLSSLFLFVGILTSCEEDKVMFSSSVDMAKFEATSIQFPVSPSEGTLELEVSVTETSNAARSISVSVNEASEALPAFYTIDSATLVVPAGEYIGKITITGNFDEVPEAGSYSLILNLDSVEGAQIDPNNNTVSVAIFRVCPTEEDLSGIHDYILYDVHLGDGAGGGTPYPDFSSSGTVEWTTEDVSSGIYINSDITFGLFPAAGYDAPAKKIQWVCNSFNVLEPDQYGDTYTYTITSCVGNVMELEFVNTWGDSGHVTLYRAGGEAWPDAFQTN